MLMSASRMTCHLVQKPKPGRQVSLFGETGHQAIERALSYMRVFTFFRFCTATSCLLLLWENPYQAI